MKNWDISKSANLYGVNDWGLNYFKINEAGNVEVLGEDPATQRVDLHHLIQDLIEGGVRLPILIRFSDITRSRISLLSNCFKKAIDDCNYQGRYQGVFPIKVNQQRHMVQEIVDLGRPYRLGLECGSKPELLVALAIMDTPDAYIICNGFKDEEYIEMALIAQKLGRQIIVVVDRAVELEMIIEASKKLNIQPNIGLRAKLYSQGSGKWNESSGAKSKFGLTPTEIVNCVNHLKDEDMLDCLRLCHFHIGSQIPSIQSIKAAIKEGARIFVELHGLGAKPHIIDVGGGLGVDYDGSGKSDSSTNYSEQEYANDIVSIMQSICDEKGVPHPDIVSESGRSLTAHSSVLVFDVLGFNEIERQDFHDITPSLDNRLVKEMYEIFETVNENNINEYYNDLIEKKRDTQNLFTYGVLSLEQRAKAEDLFWATATKIMKLARGNKDAEDIYYALENELSDSYFCNFSVFQSLPDAWALKQTFPVIPIHRLEEAPTRRATVVDLTCDSDGKIEQFLDTDTYDTQRYLEVHKLNPGEPYYMGVFLTGAYQETLGDLHNLFGDTDAVHISMGQDGQYCVDHVIHGDSVKEVLGYVQYNIEELFEKVRRSTEESIGQRNLSRNEARLLLKHYERGMSGYTYLHSNGSKPSDERF